MSNTIDNSKGGSLTSEQICIACKNIGIDLACGGCAANFYTGYNDCPHDEHCLATKTKTVRLIFARYLLYSPQSAEDVRYETVLVHCPEIEQRVNRGGRGEGVHDFTQLIGAEIIEE